MAMSESDILKGWIYRTSNQQERLVLGWDRDGRVVYSSRGKNPEKEFQNCHVRITGAKFAQRAIGKLDLEPRRHIVGAERQSARRSAVAAEFVAFVQRLLRTEPAQRPRQPRVGP